MSQKNGFSLVLPPRSSGRPSSFGARGGALPNLPGIGCGGGWAAPPPPFGCGGGGGPGLFPPGAGGGGGGGPKGLRPLLIGGGGGGAGAEEDAAAVVVVPALVGGFGGTGGSGGRGSTFPGLGFRFEVVFPGGGLSVETTLPGGGGNRLPSVVCTSKAEQTLPEGCCFISSVTRIGSFPFLPLKEDELVLLVEMWFNC